MSSLYRDVLGPDWCTLAPAIQWLHKDASVVEGSFRVERGGGFRARVVASLFALPASSDDRELAASIVRTPQRECWTRNFGGEVLQSVQWSRGSLLLEGMGWIVCAFRLRVAEGALLFEQVGAALGNHQLAIRLPRILAPSIEARVAVEGSNVRVAVSISTPFTGRLLSYEGVVTVAERRS